MSTPLSKTELVLVKLSSHEEINTSSILHWYRNLVATPSIFRPIFATIVDKASTVELEMAGINPEVYRKLIRWKMSGTTLPVHRSPQSNKMRSTDVRSARPLIIIFKTKIRRNSNSNMVCFPIITYVAVATNTIMRFQVSRRFRIVASLRTWATQSIKWITGPSTVPRPLTHTRKVIVSKRRLATSTEINRPSCNKSITCEWNKRMWMHTIKAINSTVVSTGSDPSKETTIIK